MNIIIIYSANWNPFLKKDGQPSQWKSLPDGTALSNLTRYFPHILYGSCV